MKAPFSRAGASSGTLTRGCLAFVMLCLVSQGHTQWTEQVIKSLGRSPATTGDTPHGPLLLASDGWLYGTAFWGGTGGSGTVFKLNTDGSSFQVLHTFDFFAGRDALNPYGGLIQAADGLLYGTTCGGTPNNSGAVYKLKTDGTGYAVLYRFGAFTTDGRFPFAAVIQGRDGVLYGTTARGGSNDCGTVFRLSTNGTDYAVLHSFVIIGSPDSNGGNRLVQGADGRLYGLAQTAGTNGYGAVFSINTNGTDYVELHSFGSGGDGTYPEAGLIEGRDGALYGTTYSGGTNSEPGGTVFRISPDGTDYTLLHGFDGNGPDPHNPAAGLLQGLDGALYGTTYNGGAGGLGGVFRLCTDGTGYSVLYSLGSYSGDGASSDAPVIQGPDATLYGTTVFVGANDAGALFRLSFPRPQLSSMARMADGRFRFSFTALQNYTYRIDVSTNLAHWAALTNILTTAATMQVTDLTATNSGRRFYRAAWPP